MNICNMIQSINDKMIKPIVLLMCISVALIASLTLISIVVRNVMGFSFQWVIDVNRLLFVWMCFLGLIYANHNDALIRFDFIDKKLPPNIINVIIIARYLGCIALYLIMIKAGFEIIGFAKHQQFPTIPVSMAMMYYAVVVSGICLVVQTTLKLVSFILERLTSAKPLNATSRRV